MKCNIEKKISGNNDKPDQDKQLATGYEFLKLMIQLQPDELCALSKILGVRLLTNEVDPETKKAIPRDAADIIDDCIDHYALLSRMDRRFLLKHLKKEIKERQIHGTSTEHTTQE